MTWNNYLPTGGLSWNDIFENFSKICQENSSFIKIWLELMDTLLAGLWMYLADFFWIWEMFRAKFVEYQNKHFSFNNIYFPPKILPLIRRCGKIRQSGADHRWLYGSRSLHAGHLRLQTHSRNFLLLFHDNNGCTNALQYYVTRVVTLPVYTTQPT